MSRILWMAWPFVVLCSVGIAVFLMREPEPQIVLTAKYWACTGAHVTHHEARPGMGKLLSRAAYSETVCHQWSARMTDGTLGGATLAEPLK